MVRGRELDVLIAEKVMNWKLKDGYWDGDSKKRKISEFRPIEFAEREPLKEVV